MERLGRGGRDFVIGEGLGERGDRDRRGRLEEVVGLLVTIMKSPRDWNWRVWMLRGRGRKWFCGRERRGMMRLEEVLEELVVVYVVDILSDICLFLDVEAVL
jgi:hypothetical protein